ncbi:MAG: hypothetical protein JOZ27_06775 [Caulobacteraceae bacterium]|nr:hypothetical protein [Caulobacteraceae bacterium]
MTALLPAGFGELEPFVAEWALGTEEARFKKRLASDFASLAAFQQAAFPRRQAILDHLNATGRNDPARLPDDVARLYHLALMIMEASVVTDLGWETTDIADAHPAERLHFLPPSA